MISEKMEQKLNEQIQKEFFSAYLYLSMEAYLASMNLNGFANFFHVQAQEERDHAMMFFNYVIKVNGKVSLGQIEKPATDFESIEALLKLALLHEQSVTKSIYGLVDLALEERDHSTNQFLQWFIFEQTEEEETADRNVKRFQLVKDDGKGILMLDSELAQRVYTPLTAQGGNNQA